MNAVYECPGPHDGSLAIKFHQVLMPGGYKDKTPIYNLLTPSVPNPEDYKNLQLVCKDLGWGGYDVIRAWNTDRDSVIYLGKWEEQQELITTSNHC